MPVRQIRLLSLQLMWRSAQLLHHLTTPPSLPLIAQLIAEPQHRGEQPWMVVDATLSAIAETCMSMRFPASADGGSSEVTLPFCMLTGHVMADE